jgi:hypothetical protein
MEKVTTNYARVFSEVYEILKYLPQEFIEKIPKKLIVTIAKNRDTSYIFDYDLSKEINDQDIYEETKDFISALYLTYYCAPKEKEKLLNIMKENSIKEEKELREKYNPDKIFDSNMDKTKEVSEDSDGVDYKLNMGETQEVPTALAVKKESFIIRIINKIKELLHIG